MPNEQYNPFIVENSLILAIESSCDDTSAAVICGNQILANIATSQAVHEHYGGVVPELASREHQRQIVPVVRAALAEAGIALSQLHAVAYTRGPGLLGSLHVGAAFAKSIALVQRLPLIEVHHMHAHILAHFIDDSANVGGIPELPFLCLTVSGGHTQLVLVHDPLHMEVIGTTRDDAAGEAFDKVAKLLGFPYPGGPLIDRMAQAGAARFSFPKPRIEGLDFSFSGLKTSVLYFLRKEIAANPNFIAEHLNDISASVQQAIVGILLQRLEEAIHQTGVRRIALAGGVSANSALRAGVLALGERLNCPVHVPAFGYCTDNAAMIAMAAQFKLAAKRYGNLNAAPMARLPFEHFD